MKRKKLPASLKWIFTLFMGILIPTNWIYHGVENFLWFSDITLFLAYLAVIFELRFLASMAAIGGLVLETFWIIDFSIGLFSHASFSHLTDYMFDDSLPLWVRGVSLFHAFLPPLLIWLLWRLGYSRRAWLVQTLLTWINVVVTWLVIDPSRNINWVYGYEYIPGITLSPWLYLIIECMTIGIVYAITHGILSVFMHKR